MIGLTKWWEKKVMEKIKFISISHILFYVKVYNDSTCEVHRSIAIAIRQTTINHTNVEHTVFVNANIYRF